MNKKAKWLSGLGFLLFIGLMAGSYQFIRSNLVSASSAPEVLNYRKDAIVSQEKGCSDRLQTQRTSGSGDNRSRINTSGPYAQDLWVSPDGQPASGIAVSRGGTGIDLRLYANEIICSVLVQPNSGNNLDVDPSTVITSSQFPNDRKPNADYDGSDATVHGASLWGTYTRINSASVQSGGGSIAATSNPTGSVLSFNRDDNSRYWFTQSNNFSYDTGGPIYESRHVVLKLNVTVMNRYHSTTGVVQCGGPKGTVSGLNPGNASDYSLCNSGDVLVPFDIFVPDELPSINVNFTGSCNGDFTIKALDTDNTSAKLRVDIYEDDITPPNNDPNGQSTRQYSMYTTPGSDGAAGTASVSLADVLRSGKSSDNSFPFSNSDRTGSVDWSKRRFYAYAMSVNRAGAEIPNAHTKSNPVDIGPCATVSCKANTLISLGTATVNAPTNVYITMTATNATVSPPANAQASVNITGPGGYRSGTLTTTGGFTYGSGQLKSNRPVTFRPPSSGTYTATWTYSYAPDVTPGLPGQARISASGPDCSGPIVAAYSPYFRILGGDAAVGAGFNDTSRGTCDANPSAKLQGKNRNGDAGSYFGAGTQLAALALGNISGVSTGTNNAGNGSGSDMFSGANPIPKALMFATSSKGQFGLSNWCMPDYGQGSAGTDFAGSINLSDLTDKEYRYNMTGGVTITASRPITGGKQLKIVLIGNQTVQIDSDILYSYSNLQDIPNVQIIVNGGNLAVNSSVDTLYGTYIAEKRILPGARVATGGTFNTCTIGGSAISPTSITSINDCKNALTIYGPTAASKYILARTNGNLYAATGADTSTAETFVFSPQSWVPAKQTGIGSVDAVTSLPPVL